MLRRLLLILTLLLSGATALGRIGTIDITPSATLLFPHFEVDVQNPDGVDTLITIQNSSATAILGNVTFWTDFGLPTAHFLIYLTGYDMQTIDLRDVFKRLVPITASDGQDPSDTQNPNDGISNQGPLSQDINFASCSGYLPEAPSSGVLIGPDLVAAHSGRPSPNYFNGQCGSFNYGDNIARGYITVDTVNNCTVLKKPGDSGYFINGGAGDATTQNVMLGDWTLLASGHRPLFTDNAVHIEASATDPLTSGGPAKYTFYGRLVGFTAADNREPLPTAWAGFASAGRTSMDYWRDPAAAIPSPVACGTTPAPYPLGERQVTAFDANGGHVPVAPANHFPLATGHTPDSALGLSASLGWAFLNLNLPGTTAPFSGIRQSWVSFRQIPRSAATNSSQGYAVPGLQLGNAAYNDSPTLP